MFKVCVGEAVSQTDCVLPAVRRMKPELSEHPASFGVSFTLNLQERKLAFF